MMIYGRGAERWADDVEELIAAGVDRMVHRLEARKSDPSLAE